MRFVDVAYVHLSRTGGTLQQLIYDSLKNAKNIALAKIMQKNLRNVIEKILLSFLIYFIFLPSLIVYYI